MAFTQKELIVVDLFVAAYGRAPTKAGLDAFVAKMDNDGWTDRDIANYMFDTANNPEAATRYPDSASLEDKVNAIFNHVLGRPVATQQGMDFWKNKLADPNYTLADVVLEVIKAAKEHGEDQQTLENKEAVVEYFLNTVPADQQAGNQVDVDNVKNDPATVLAAKDAIDAIASAAGKTFTLTPGVDTPANGYLLTDGNDTVIGESSTIGKDDVILDTSIKDNDVMNITLTTDMAPATITNVEQINVTLNTLGGTKVDAKNITGANITVGSTQFGFSGAAEIDNLGKNDATAGENITDLTVTGITTGTIDTGSADKIIATVDAATDSISLKTNGDVTLDATAAYTDLNLEAAADSVVTIAVDRDGDGTVDSKYFTGKATVTGDADVTIKTEATGVDGKEIINDGNGEITIELTDDAAVDLTKADTNKVITDVAYTKEIKYNGENELDVTMKEAANKATITAVVEPSTGGTVGATTTVHLTKEANADELTFKDIIDATVDAQEGGTIAKIDGSATADITLIAGDDLTVTDLDAKDKAVTIDASSAGDVVLKAVQAQVVKASDFENALTLTQSDNEQIAVVGGKGKNNITTIATDKAVSVVTQDADDTVTIANTTGKATVATAAGNDTVTAEALEGKATLDLGDGDNTLSVKGAAATADITVTASAGNDTMTVGKGSDGKIVADLGGGNDIADLSEGVATTADITLTMGDGDDVIKAKGAATETLTLDGGAGNDVVEVAKDSDMSDATVTFTDIEELKVEEKATFAGEQLSGQTFKISGTGDDDQVIVEVESVEGGEETTDLSTIDFDNTMPSGIEYVEIDTSASKGDDMIKGAHGVVNHVILGDGADTLQLFADSMGTKLVETDPNADGVKTADVQSWKPADKADFNIAVVENFVSADDSLILGNAANVSNYRDVQLQVERDDTAAGKDLIKLLEEAINAANTEMQTHTDVEYVYAYNTGKAADNSSPGSDSFLLWDTDGDHDVDAAILLVGINAQDAFDHTDIVAPS